MMVLFTLDNMMGGSSLITLISLVQNMKMMGLFTLDNMMGHWEVATHYPCILSHSQWTLNLGFHDGLIHCHNKFSLSLS